MKTIIHVITIAAVSQLAACSLTAQTTTASTAAPKKAQGTPLVDQEAKEKAEDAILLQQIEAGGQDAGNGPKLPPNQWAPEGLPPNGGVGAGIAPLGAPYRVQNLLARPAGGPGRALLVRTSTPEPKAQAALEEDLTVMAHLLDKAIEELPGGQRHAMTAMGINVFFAPGSAPMRSLYLDNYGAVFFLNVSFPLVAPSEKHEEEKPAADSAWEDARQELYGQHQVTVAGEPAEDYSQEKVDKLKETLLEALKNATNIRDLKPDEFVTLWVSGGTSGGPGRTRFVRRINRAPLGGNTMTAEQLTPPARRTVLTIRASKADIDALAQGKLNAEEFEKRAKITAYTNDAPGGAEGVFVGGGYAGKTRF